MTNEKAPSRKWWARLLGEFLVIVVGVLVALGVDDLRQASEDRELESYLRVRLAQDLDEDIEELERVILRAERRLWLINTVLGVDTGGDDAPSGPFPAGDADVIGNCVPSCDPYSSDFRPLSVLAMFTQFDLSDGTYREMLATGSLRVLRDLALRESLAAYYNLAAEGAAGDQRSGQYHEQFLDELQLVGLTSDDPLALPELRTELASHPSMMVTLRRLRSTIRNQLFNYERVYAGAKALRSGL
jgi:hypothetical protein